jgi:hypothetical protein
MNISTTLPYLKSIRAPGTLSFIARPTALKQVRVKDRICFEPVIDLDAFRFHAVIDWIDVKVALGRPTQHQHVQAVLAPLLNRTSYIDSVNAGPGSVAETFVIRIQEPPPIATLMDIAETLETEFGFTAQPVITAIEISIDAYPKDGREESRAVLLGAMQRTIFTGRDITTNKNSRPRTVFGKKDPTTAPPAAPVAGSAKAAPKKFRLIPWPNNKTITEAACIRPQRYRSPAIDGTMYLGAEDDDMMIKLMDKIIDTQHVNGTFVDLQDNRKRVRVEVTLQGEEPARIGLTDLASLEDFKFTRLQGEYFQFKLPTFVVDDGSASSTRSIAKAMHQTNRKIVFQKAGTVGLMVMDAARKRWRASEMSNIGTILSMMDLKKKETKRVGTGTTEALTSYNALNKKMALALRDLGHREARAFKKRGGPAIL